VRDVGVAVGWYRRAADLGSASARQALVRLGKN
jgi:TPR repeat protein